MNKTCVVGKMILPSGLHPSVDFESCLLCSITKARLYYVAPKNSNPDKNIKIFCEDAITCDSLS